MSEALAVNLGASCWLFQGGKTGGGYGAVYREGRQWMAHRYFWTVMRGPIPEGLQIDHLCRVRHCVNPQHMELVTSRENTLRGLKGELLTHCPQGHEYSPENTYRWRSRSRQCRRCNRVRQSERRASIKSQ